MAFNGSGTFVINTSGQPVVPNTVISATTFNALTNDLANGLSTCITKDGQTTPTANIPMGNNKITGLAPGTSGTDAANLSQVQSSTAKLLQSVTGTDTITAAMVPALTSYSAGQMFYFVAAGDNTGAVTINIDSLGAKSVTRDGSTALVAGDIVSGEVALIVYDGTRFQLLNGNSFTNLNVSNNLTLSGGTANGVLYLNGSKVATSGTALVFDGTNLGIGTSSPGVRLHSKSSAAENTRLEGTTARGSGNVFMSFYDPTGRKGYLGYGSSSDDGYYIINEMNAPMIFYTNNTERARIDSSGNLGIGTTSPSYRLQAEVGAGSQNILLVGQTGVSNGYTITSNGSALTHSWHTAGNVNAQITANGSFVAGRQTALATTATDGFLYVPTCAGTPTGTPTAITGMAPIVVNTTNNKLYFYSGGAWRDAGP
jgi:hypothetical protein